MPKRLHESRDSVKYINFTIRSNILNVTVCYGCPLHLWPNVFILFIRL